MQAKLLSSVKYSFPVTYSLGGADHKLMCQCDLKVNSSNVPVEKETVITFYDKNDQVLKGIKFKQTDLNEINQRAIKNYLKSMSTN